MILLLLWFQLALLERDVIPAALLDQMQTDLVLFAGLLSIFVLPAQSCRIWILRTNINNHQSTTYHTVSALVSRFVPMKTFDVPSAHPLHQLLQNYLLFVIILVLVGEDVRIMAPPTLYILHCIVM